MRIQKIRPFLWYRDRAEAAAEFYCQLFPDSRVLNVTRAIEGGPLPAGHVMTVHFQLNGLEMIALNGGPMFSFTEAVSFSVDCEDQAEVDALWIALTDGGIPGRCGWLKDRFGLSWQIIPRALPELLGSGNTQVAQRVMQAMMGMKKIDIAGLRAAAGVAS